MNKLPGTNRYARLAVLSVALLSLLSACSKPETVDRVEATPAQYVLKDIRYFFGAGDRVDTTTLALPTTTVQNPGTGTITQQMDEGFGGLVKTSRFSIDPASQQPAGLDLGTLAVSVPQHWYGNGLFDRSIETYPLSTVQQQKPYGFAPNRQMVVRIPPKAKVALSRQITAYQLICSFEGTIENKTTGQRYTLTGHWNGLLQYANPSTTLQESAL